MLPPPDDGASEELATGVLVVPPVGSRLKPNPSILAPALDRTEEHKGGGLCKLFSIERDSILPRRLRALLDRRAKLASEFEWK